MVEGLYSADGDVPDLRGLIELRDRFDALLFVDEAHSIGTIGATGRGICERSGVDPASVDVVFGTLSKALGGCGGFVASRRDLIEYLRYTCPGYVFSAAMPPVTAAAARAALSILQSEPSRPARVAGLARRFLEACLSRGLDTGRSGGFPVATIRVGDTATALEAAVRLFEDGLLVSPMIAPAVPEGAARLRFFLSVHHDEADVDKAADAVARAVAAARSN